MTQALDIIEATMLHAVVNGFEPQRAQHAPEVSRLIAIISKHRRERRQKAEGIK